MEKKFYKSQKVMLDDLTYLDKSFFLDYYILETRKANDKNEYEKNYGIEIVKHYTDYFKNKVVQQREINCITKDEDEIYKFADKMVENIVTPISLDDVVSDYFTKKAINAALS
ncbi:MAG: hypothetical protein E7404_08680 [Ruminococcaceae bacterium]|nr:hypothetical protein [Oscillospiraceae bacterium]